MTAPSAAMREAAEEIAAYSDSVYGPKDGPSFGRELQLETIAAIIAKHAPPADAAVAQMRAQRMREGAPDFGLILTESTVDILYGKWKEGRELSRDELDALFRTALALHWDDDMRECERNELRAALAAGPADAVPVEPTHCFNADDWEVTYEWRDRGDLADELGLKDSLRVGVLVRQPDKWIACVPVTWDEDGSPDETAIRWFDSLEEAEAAINAEPPR